MVRQQARFDEAADPDGGRLGGAIKTGRVLDFSKAGDDKRKLGSLYPNVLDGMGSPSDRFGDADTRLAGL